MEAMKVKPRTAQKLYKSLRSKGKRMIKIPNRSRTAILALHNLPEMSGIREASMDTWDLHAH
jgi:hypothetical protein